MPRSLAAGELMVEIVATGQRAGRDGRRLTTALRIWGPGGPLQWQPLRAEVARPEERPGDGQRAQTTALTDDRVAHRQSHRTRSLAARAHRSIPAPASTSALRHFDAGGPVRRTLSPRRLVDGSVHGRSRGRHGDGVRLRSSRRRVPGQRPLRHLAADEFVRRGAGATGPGHRARIADPGFGRVRPGRQGGRPSGHLDGRGDADPDRHHRCRRLRPRLLLRPVGSGVQRDHADRDVGGGPGGGGAIWSIRRGIAARDRRAGATGPSGRLHLQRLGDRRQPGLVRRARRDHRPPRQPAAPDPRPHRRGPRGRRPERLVPVPATSAAG